MNDGLTEEKKELTQDDLARERTELSELRTGMATERTDLAYERTALTNSQTFLAYCRTAIGTFAAGIGMFEFINNPEIVHIGMGLMVASPIIVIIGAVHFLRVRHRLEQEAERRKQVAARIEQEYREAREEQLEN
ncbi:MAG: DUF202 domain-containing protein [Clostridiales bacterium]|nr:DUF202 domain-containing protein [Clostridiales bacterium]MBQ3322828.1 DUF202 domain-containing protein [Bacillota bacterium]